MISRDKLCALNKKCVCYTFEETEQIKIGIFNKINSFIYKNIYFFKDSFFNLLNFWVNFFRVNEGFRRLSTILSTLSFTKGSELPDSRRVCGNLCRSTRTGRDTASKSNFRTKA